MKVGTENKRQLIIAGVVGFFALLAIYPLYQELFGGPTTPPPAPPVIHDAAPPVTAGTGGGSSFGGAAGVSFGGASPTGAASASGNAQTGFKAAPRVGKTAASLDPTLHMAAMERAESLVYEGSGRNIFSGGPAAVTQVAVRAPKAVAPARQVPVASLRPVYTPPPGPPAINLKFFGTATRSNGNRQAFLCTPTGDDVFLASPGDVVERRYRVVSIAANSIVIEDLPNSNRQTLPLLSN